VDFTSVLKNELFRPVTTLIIPGAIALGPWILVIRSYYPVVHTFWTNHPDAFVAIISICVISAGLVLDNVGAAIEYYAWDAILKHRQSGHWDRWEAYLKLKISDEYVGQRYLRNTLVRMKFELAMIPALTSFGIGLAWSDCRYHLWSTPSFTWIAILIGMAAGFFAWESFQSAKILANTRRLLLEAEGKLSVSA
jgi:hypothetical protein